LDGVRLALRSAAAEPTIVHPPALRETHLRCAAVAAAVAPQQRKKQPNHHQQQDRHQ